jgi:hypothetical protein
VPSDEGNVGETQRDLEKPERQDLEDPERLEPLRARHPVDEKIRGRPDQRHRAAEDRGIAERDQKLGWRKAELLRDLDEDGDHDDDHGGVVHDRRGEGHDDEEDRQRHDRPVVGLRLGPFRQPVERARPHQPAHDQEHGEDRPGRGVRQDRPRGVIGHDAHEQHEGRPGQRRDLGRKALAHEEDKHHDDGAERKKGGPGFAERQGQHGGGSSDPSSDRILIRPDGRRKACRRPGRAIAARQAPAPRRCHGAAGSSRPPSRTMATRVARPVRSSVST